MTKRPNIMMFMPDQLRADCVNAFGDRAVHTPNIAALAKSGTKFTNAFSQHSVCSPSRVSMFTGWYPHVAGHRTLTNLIKSWEPNLLRYLKDAGYNVAWVGQRGDTFAPGVTDLSTSFRGFKTNPKMFFEFSHKLDNAPLPRAHFHGKRLGKDGSGKGPFIDFDEATILSAEEWLASSPKEPWVLFIALIFPHPPFEVEDPWFSMYRPEDIPLPDMPDFATKPRFMRELSQKHGWHRLTKSDWQKIIATYYGMVSRVDSQLGRVMKAIEKAGAARNTISAFFTDHGEYLGDFGLVEKWPSGLDDCLLRNPFVMSGPGISQNATATSMVEMIDLLPTLLEFAEIEVHHTHFGKSLLPLLKDASTPHKDAAFSEGGFTRTEAHLLETSNFPYDVKAGLQYDDPTTVGKATAIRTQDWTYIDRLYEDDELYDRHKDPGELTNLARDPVYKETVRQLRDRLLDWYLETSDVIPWKSDPRFDPGAPVEKAK